MDVILVVLASAALTAIPWLFKAGGEGRYRRGVGWYMDVRSKRETLVEGEAPATRIGMPRGQLVMWLGSSGGLAILAVVGWVVSDAPALGVIIGLIALLCLGAAIQGWRENRYLQGPEPDPSHLPRRSTKG